MYEIEWWYSKQGMRHGPLSEAELQKRLIALEISPGTRVWRKGMAGWTSMVDVAALQKMLEDCPPPIAENDTHFVVDFPRESIEEDPRTTTIQNKDSAHKPRNSEGNGVFYNAGPWSRFFGRWIDYMLYGVLFSVLIEFISPDLAQRFRLLDPIYIVFISWPMASLFGLLIEVPIMAGFGNTLGKWIFGIRVRRADGSELAVKEIIRRNMSLWLYGLCLGIPIANLFCLVANYRRVKAGKQCRWDETARHEVRQKRSGKLRMSVGILIPASPLIFAFFIGVITSFWTPQNGIFQVANNELDQASMRTWANPLTGVAARLDG